MTPRLRQDHSKWYKMVLVNGACKHGKYEQIWLKSVCIRPNINVSAMHLSTPPAVQQVSQTQLIM